MGASLGLLFRGTLYILAHLSETGLPSFWEKIPSHCLQSKFAPITFRLYRTARNRLTFQNNERNEGSTVSQILESLVSSSGFWVFVAIAYT